MNDVITLDENYSTTRSVIKTDPQEIAGLVKASNKPEEKFETVLFLPEGEGRQGEGGLRTQGYFKVGGLISDQLSLRGVKAPWQSSNSEKENRHSREGGNLSSPLTTAPSPEAKPLITVVTVVFNGEQFLEETILSVINQTYDNVEYIIIDGGSTDGTIDIIKQYEHAIDYWVSEKDRGIYDAMNKGLDLSVGEWINFMNGGDRFSKSKVLKEVFQNQHYSESILYGDVVADYGSFKKELKSSADLSKLWKGMCFSHQSIFFKSSYHKAHKYNLNYKLAADFEVIYYSYINNQKFKYLQKKIAVIDIGGVSYVQREKVLAEYRKVSCGVNLGIRRYYFYFSIVSFKLKKALKFILGRRMTMFVIKRDV